MDNKVIAYKNCPQHHTQGVLLSGMHKILSVWRLKSLYYNYLEQAYYVEFTSRDRSFTEKILQKISKELKKGLISINDFRQEIALPILNRFEVRYAHEYMHHVSRETTPYVAWIDREINRLQKLSVLRLFTIAISNDLGQ